MSWKRVSTLVVGVAAAGLLLAGQASALSSVTSLFVGDGVTLELAQDDYAEWALTWDSATGAYVPHTGILGVGDVLFGVININAVNTIDIGVGTSYNELTGYFMNEVKSVNTYVGGGGITHYEYEFGVVGAATGQMITLYEDGSQDFNILSGTSQADAIASATNGTPVLGLGFAGDVDEFWYADTTTNDVSEILANPNQDFGDFWGALTALWTNWNVTFLDVPNTLGGFEPGPVDGDGLVNGVAMTAGTIKGPQTGQLTSVAGDVDLNFKVNVIPEPATMGLLGTGLIGLAIGGRRRSRKS